jgi:hypothetical protein
MATLVISYSRVDRPLVRMLVRLLRAGLREVDRAVFWDDDIAAGERWRETFQHEVEKTGQLFVMWCTHSAASRQVTSEYTFALEHLVRIVPVLLDDTPLAEALAPFNAVDLRRLRHFDAPLNDAPVVPRRDRPRSGLPDSPYSAAELEVLETRARLLRIDELFRPHLSRVHPD